MKPPGIHTVGVVGGGTSGYFAALALQRRFPGLAITVLESPTIPIIGVGEATTTLMPPFLHAELGLDVVELFERVRPSFKLGIRFEWGKPAPHAFSYPFGPTDPHAAFTYDGDLRAQSLTSLLMQGNGGPVVADDTGTHSLLPSQKVAYHLDNAPFVAFLADAARARGIQHRTATIDEVEVGEQGVSGLRLSDGTTARFDLYVDASGFRSLLLGKALGTPFESFASTLFCDTAVVAAVPHGGLVRPYTTAETMDAGWCWRIPVEREDHRGYVFSSAHLSLDAAAAELARKNPGAGEPWVVRFRSGRHRRCFAGNVLALGNAYGFVEPLESTALHMVIVTLHYALGALASGGAAQRDDVDAKVGAHWDFLRGFLGLHYRFNRRLDTPFWQAARAEVDLAGLTPFVERFRAGDAFRLDARGHQHGDPAFGNEGASILLLGQEVPFDNPPPRVSEADFRARALATSAVAGRALPHAEALAWLRVNPAALRTFAEHPRSWVQASAERLAGDAPVHPGHERERHGEAPLTPYDPLLRGLA
ncbi:MAG: tryptophan 7-halogenase [Myxococcales bacterium]|nr:tryptophan 7-halogenase [Myxococcales bacterium]